MEQLVSRQALGLVIAGLLGLGAGLGYDLIRPFRRRSSALGAALLDCFFSLSVAIAAFFYAMGADSGRLGLWELSMTLLSFLAYMHLVSDEVYRLSDAMVSAGLTFFRLLIDKIKKFKLSIKKYFHNVRK